jgi:hypothetical protein
LFDRLSVDVEEAATAFPRSVRLMLRLCRSRPQISAVLVRERMHYMESEGGVAPRLLRDIRAGAAPGPVPQGRAAVGPSRRLRCGAGHAADVADDPELVDDAACDYSSNSCCARWACRSMRRAGSAHAPLPVAELPKPC